MQHYNSNNDNDTNRATTFLLKFLENIKRSIQNLNYSSRANSGNFIITSRYCAIQRDA